MTSITSISAPNGPIFGPSPATRRPIDPPAVLRLTPARSAAGVVAAAASGGGAGKRPWWAPIFMSIVGETGSEGAPEEAPPAAEESKGRRARLTAEKARVLRKEMRASENWHDAMYHSAIASRLASPDSS